MGWVMKAETKEIQSRRNTHVSGIARAFLTWTGFAPVRVRHRESQPEININHPFLLSSLIIFPPSLPLGFPLLAVDMPHKVYAVEEVTAHPVHKMVPLSTPQVIGAGRKPLPAAYK